MKFTDGYWHKREGYTLYSPCQVRDLEIGETSVTLYASPWRVEHRGQTLNSPLLTLVFTSPRPGILALEAYHFAGDRYSGKKEPRFRLDREDCPLEAAKGENVLSISSGPMRAEITLDPYRVVYSYNGRRLTASGNNRLAYATTPEGPHMLEQLELDVGEKIYGLGERFTPLVKNGQSVDIWNEDGGTASEQSYKNIPFYLSSRGYGVLVDHACRVSYEVASEVVSRAQFSVPGQCLRYLVVGGDTRKDVLSAYTALTGRPALPPAWSFGLWLTTSFTTDYNEDTVMSFVDGMLERDIPLHVFHYDCFWMREYEWCNFTWDSAMFPDAEAMLRRIKAKGLKICVWINSYIGQKSPLFREAASAGYLLRRPDGSVWQWDRWQPGMGIVDFSNPAACHWYREKLRALLRRGVDCFKTDFGERIPVDVVYHDGSDPVAMHNYHPQMYNQLVFELLREERGEGEAVVFARSATAGGQQFPVHWGGDCDSTYVSMAESLRGGLSLTMSGFGFWSHDISGFEATATPDLYKRWSAFGLLSTHSRLHGSGSYRVPWLFDEETVEVLRFFAKLKCRLMPYLFSAAVETSRTGVPSMRAMALEFEEDPACLDIETQYMLGGSLLVAPVFNDRGEGLYYLPAGRWTHLLTGECTEGGGWRRETCDYFSLPLFVRENTLLPMGANDRDADYDYGRNLTLRLYALGDGGEAAAAVYSRSGDLLLNARASRKGSEVEIVWEGSAAPDVLLAGIRSVKSAAGAVPRESGEGLLLTNASGRISLVL